MFPWSHDIGSWIIPKWLSEPVFIKVSALIDQGKVYNATCYITSNCIKVCWNLNKNHIFRREVVNYQQNLGRTWEIFWWKIPLISLLFKPKSLENNHTCVSMQSMFSMWPVICISCLIISSLSFCFLQMAFYKTHGYLLMDVWGISLSIILYRISVRQRKSTGLFLISVLWYKTYLLSSYKW